MALPKRESVRGLFSLLVGRRFARLVWQDEGLSPLISRLSTNRPDAGGEFRRVRRGQWVAASIRPITLRQIGDRRQNCAFESVGQSGSIG
jgi:hypothetical protein